MKIVSCPRKGSCEVRNKHVNPVYRTTEFNDSLYFTQGDSWLVDITVGDDFLGLYDQKDSYQYVSLVTKLWMSIIAINTLLWITHCSSHYTTLNQLEQELSVKVATCTIHNWVAVRVAAGSGIFKYLFKAWVSVNWRQLLDVKLNFYFNCASLLFCSIYFQ